MGNEERKAEWADLLGCLLSHISYIKGDEYKVLEWIFNLSWETHKDQKRADGSPYWDHITAIVDKLEDLGVVDPFIWALALGHDVFENSQEHAQKKGESLKDFKLRTEDFILSNVNSGIGSKLAADLISLTKPQIDGVAIRTETQRMDTYIEQLYWSSKGVVLVKMVDRWHNLQTLGPFSKEKRRQQCIETGVYMLDLFEEIDDPAFGKVYLILLDEIYTSLDFWDPEWKEQTIDYQQQLRNRELLASISNGSVEAAAWSGNNLQK